MTLLKCKYSLTFYVIEDILECFEKLWQLG